MFYLLFVLRLSQPFPILYSRSSGSLRIKLPSSFAPNISLVPWRAILSGCFLWDWCISVLLSSSFKVSNRHGLRWGWSWLFTPTTGLSPLPSSNINLPFRETFPVSEQSLRMVCPRTANIFGVNVEEIFTRFEPEDLEYSTFYWRSTITPKTVEQFLKLSFSLKAFSAVGIPTVTKLIRTQLNWSYCTVLYW